MDTNYKLTVQDFKDWEEKHGRIPDKSIILLYTGKSKFYRTDPLRYYGFPSVEVMESKDVTQLTNPGNLLAMTSLYLRQDQLW